MLDAITDLDVEMLIADRFSGTKSIAMARRGSGSLFLEFRPSGLVKISHRVRDRAKTWTIPERKNSQKTGIIPIAFLKYG